MALLGPDGQPATPGTTSTQSTPSDPAVPMRVSTAFVVYQLPNGIWEASTDLEAAIVPSRPAVPDDIIGGAENVKLQVAARKAANMAAATTVQTQVAMARQMQAQHQSQQLTPQEASALAQTLQGYR